MKSKATTFYRNQSLEAVNNCLLNICSEDREKCFRLDAVKYMVIANISASGMEKIRPFIENNSKPGLNIGSTIDLIRDYAEPTLQNIIDDIYKIMKAIEIIDNFFPHLSQYANLLLQDPTKCWYLLPNGGWQFFTQEEGLPQGCPFSPVFAALVLHTIIQPIDKLLRKRAKTRLKNKILGDDNKGGITNLLAYVDDLNCVIPHEDALFFCKTFKRLATNIGLRLNEKKSTILTNTSGESILTHLPDITKQKMKQCFIYF